MLSDYFFLAVKNVRKRGIRSWLTILGIFLGIAAVVSLISLGQGLQTAITGQFSTLDQDKLVIENTGTGFGPPGSTAVKKLTSHDLKLIEQVSGVEFAIPRLIRVVKIDFNKISKFEGAASIPSDKEQIEIVNDVLNLKMQEGKLLEETDRGRVVLGNNFAGKEKFDKEITVGTRLNIQKRDFEVKGILKRGSSFIINDIILMPEDDLKEIVNIEDEIDLIAVQVENQDRIEEVAKGIERRLRKDRDEKIGEEDFSVETPLQSIESINNILEIINLVVAGIAAISLLVGGIGIANTMFTSVLERRREIGVMKAVGAQNKDILTIFLIESGLLGLIGGIVGAVIGLILAFSVSKAASSFLGGIDLNVIISYPLLLASLAFSLTIGVLSGIIPAYQASKLNPVEALRS